MIQNEGQIQYRPNIDVILPVNVMFYRHLISSTISLCILFFLIVKSRQCSLRQVLLLALFGELTSCDNGSFVSHLWPCRCVLIPYTQSPSSGAKQALPYKFGSPTSLECQVT